MRGSLQGIVVSMGLLPLVSLAHHSRAEFTGEIQEIQGELVSIDWRNPHPEFVLKQVNADGGEAIWDIQGYGSLYTLQRQGVTRETFNVGETVKLAGQPSARRDLVFLVTHMLLPDGLQVVLRRSMEPYWTNEHIGGNDAYDDVDSHIVDTLGENRGIFRVWSNPSDGAQQSHYPFTQEAITARDQVDPLNDFATRCEAPGMPQMMGSPHPWEFVDYGSYVSLQGGDFGRIRTIHLTDTQDPVAQAPTELGYSVGRWEGRTLIVATTRINWPYFDFRGTPVSDAVETIERFTLSEDQSRLDHHMTIIDSMTFTEPATRQRYWLALGESLPKDMCVLR